MTQSKLVIAQIGFRALPQQNALGGIEVWVQEVGARTGCYDCVFLALVRKKYCHLATCKNGLIIKPMPGIWTKNLETLSHSLVATIFALNKSNIIHYHGNLSAFWCFIPKFFGIPTVVTLHGADWKRRKWRGLMKRLHKLSLSIALKYSDQVCSVSEPLSKQLGTGILNPPKFIPNGCQDLNLIKLKKNTRQFNQPAKICFLGRIVPEKRIEDIIQAVQNISPSLVHLTIAGDAPYMSSYKNKLKELVGDDLKISFVGALFGKEKHCLLNNTDILCLASEVEGMSLTFIEAVKAGITVVASDIPENRWLMQRVSKNADQFLFPSGCHQSLKNKLLYAINNLDSQHLNTELEYQLSWDSITEKYIDIYRKIIE